MLFYPCLQPYRVAMTAQGLIFQSSQQPLSQMLSPVGRVNIDPFHLTGSIGEHDGSTANGLKLLNE